MPLHIQEAKGKDLPADATHGFKILDGGEPLMFFHWHQDGAVQPPPTISYDKKGDPLEIIHDPARVTEYGEVLAAIPDRLSELGLERERDAVLGEVVGMFGAG